MPLPAPVTYEQFLEFYTPGLGRRALARKIADACGLKAESLRRSIWLREYTNQAQRARHEVVAPTPAVSTEFEDLIEEKCRRFEQYNRKKKQAEVVDWHVGGKAIAIVHFGDPHLDNNGCDFPQLREDVQLVRSTPGCYAGNIGDNTDNWVGRLVKLYAKSHTTFEEALRLSEWLIQSMEWAYFVYGNHDHWNDGATILDLLMRGATVHCRAGHDAKLRIHFDNGAIADIRARHNYRGYSMWHPTHGMLRALQFGTWGDLLVGGHTHEYGEIKTETHRGEVKIGLRVRGYKRHDDYAEEKGFYEFRAGAAIMTVIDPNAPASDRLQNFVHLPTGAKYLKSLRDE